MFAVYDVALIPIIVGLVELLKGVGLPRQWCPVFAVIFGMVGGVVYLYPDDFKTGMLFGLIMGLSASGLYSSSKEVMFKNREDDFFG